MFPIHTGKESVTGEEANCHTEDYTQQGNVIPLPRRLLVRNVAAALNNQKCRYEHVGADVAMLDEIPDRNRQTYQADAVGAIHESVTQRAPAKRPVIECTVVSAVGGKPI